MAKEVLFTFTPVGEIAVSVQGKTEPEHLKVLEGVLAPLTSESEYKRTEGMFRFAEQLGAGVVNTNFCG